MQAAFNRAVDSKVNTQLSVIVEGIGDAFYALDGNWRFTYINRAAEAYFGISREMMLHHQIWDLFPGAEGTALRRRYEEVVASGEPASFESEAVGVPGRYLEFHVFPYEGGLGVSFRDWTERRRAEEELRESEARLSSLANNALACMFYQTSHSSDFRERKVLYVSKTCERLTGIPAEVVQADPGLLYNLVLPEYREEMLAREIEAQHALRAFQSEFEMWHAQTGEARWHRIIVTPRRLENGAHVWDGIQIDVTDHKRAEVHLRLLVNELNHRVKNTLATVQSLTAQSFNRPGSRRSEEAANAYRTFEARLFALARGHDVLTRENWEGASLADIVAQTFAPYRCEDPEECPRIQIDGPDLRVPPPVALSLSMALHELSTNALKYGALGSSGGQVRVSWPVARKDQATRLSMRWEEHGGPTVPPPSRKGFGSRLIQQGLAGS
ncbi:sensor histidine kinase [Microvirga roseola]|uniref:sensor histidine kinase n=1 Tax=Microvirga roseola TaxID=2883126 RepID=UPI001E2B50E5|nr:HWE histidine kinase domain-containing protein [Microvirga roseola]